MRRIYKQFTKRAKVTITEVEFENEIVALVGFATFFFGFGAGALLNLYLIAINHPLVHQFRTALSYKSAIFGDGILLPLINMLAAAFIVENWKYATPRVLQTSLVLGIWITGYFHVEQARNGVVNWAMPQAWHWNVLGVWHAIYMFAVATLISLFYLLVLKVGKEEKEIPRQALFVTAGIILFFVLLRLDYITIDLSTFAPQF